MKILIYIWIIILPLVSTAQNLIINPSFEDINYCEAQIPCTPIGWYSVSDIPYGYQNNLSKTINGKHSLAFMIAMEQEEIRTYWQTKLLCNPEAGKQYDISFNLYSPDKYFDPNYFGIYFSDSLFRSKNDTLIHMSHPTIIPEKSIKILKNGWYKISFTYQAHGSEKYILLGNFNNSSNKKILNTAGNRKKYIEYYIDNISFKSINKESGKCEEYKNNYDSMTNAHGRHKDFYDKQPAKKLSENENSIPQTKPDSLLLGNINFKFDSDNLINTKLLNNYFTNANLNEIYKIEIIGYTDSIGKASYNLKLSERRALSVKEFLIKNYNLADSIILAIGKGILKEETLEKNRRVELRIYKKK